MVWKVLAFGAVALIGREFYLQTPRPAERDLEKQISMEVVNWHRVFYDTMEQFDVDHGTSFIKVEYPVGWNEADEIVEIIVRGRVKMRDGHVELVRKRCIRGDSTRLSDRPVTFDEDEPFKKREPYCFIELDHKQEYQRKPRSEWVDWDNEITAIDRDEMGWIMGAVAHPLEVQLRADAKVATKPPRWQRSLSDWGGRRWDWIEARAQNIASWFERS